MINTWLRGHDSISNTWATMKLHWEDAFRLIIQQNLKAALKTQRGHEKMFLTKTQASLSFDPTCKCSPLSRKTSRTLIFIHLVYSGRIKSRIKLSSVHWSTPADVWHSPSPHFHPKGFTARCSRLCLSLMNLHCLTAKYVALCLCFQPHKHLWPYFKISK